MEFAAGFFERLAHALDGIDDRQAFNQLHIHMGGVADKSEDRVLAALGDVDLEVLGFQPGDKVVALLPGYAGLQYCDHGVFS